MSEFNDTLERISMQLEQIEESLPRRPLWKRRLLEDLLSGAARGIGFSIGFTVLGALILYVFFAFKLHTLTSMSKTPASILSISTHPLDQSELSAVSESFPFLTFYFSFSHPFRLQAYHP